MKIPAKTKFRKSQKIRLSGVATACNSVSFGFYGVKVCENIKVNARQIEAVRKVISRTMKRAGVLYVRVFPHLPVTKKSLGVRGGGGKGAIDQWVYPARSGTILFEVENVPYSVVEEALNKVKYKLAAKCAIVRRRFAYES